MPPIVNSGSSQSIGSLMSEALGFVLFESGRMFVVGGTSNTLVNNNIAERRGLGNVAQFWPEVTVVGSPEEYLEADHSRAVVNFKLPYEFRGAFAAMLIGWPFRTAGGFRRHLPEVYRNWTFELGDNWQLAVPSTPVMYCTKVSIKGHGLRVDWKTQNPAKMGGNYYPDPQFENAIVTAIFETLAFDVLTLSEITETADRPEEMQRWVIKTEDSGGRYLQFQTGQWVLRNPTSGVTQKAGNRNQNFWESYETVVYEWFDVLPGMTDHRRNQRLCGLTNHATFDGYPPETLILQRAGRAPRKTPIGQRVYTYRFEFQHIPTGVNRALPPGPAAEELDPITGLPIYWDIVKEGTAGTTNIKPYKKGDMTLLFRPDTAQIVPIP